MAYDLKAIEKTLKIAPNCYLSINLKVHKIDYKKMAKEQPILLDTFARCMNGKDNPEQTQMWKNYENAYNELKSAGFYNESFENDYQEVIGEFISKVNGPNLIPVKKLKDILTKKTRKGVVTYEFEYSDFSDLIEEYYSIETHGFFGSYFHKKEEAFNRKYLPMTDEEYEKISNTSPMESEKAAKLSLISDAFDDDLYVDFWHHMLDTDFSDISNGSVATMWAQEEYPQESDDLKQQIFSLIRKVFFKEVTSLPAFKDGVEEIEFSINW